MNSNGRGRGGDRENAEKGEVTERSKDGEEEIYVNSGDGAHLKQETEFKCLGSMLCKGGGSELAARERGKEGIVQSKIELGSEF